MAESRRFRIGYALASKKNQSFIQPSLVNLAKDRGIDLLPIDITRSLFEQGPFDCVLHKLYGDDWKAHLKDFAVKHPSVPIIDHPDDIEPLNNRISMLQLVSELKIPQGKETFGVPRQIVIYDSMSQSDSGDVAVLRFPVIAKPLVADGSAKSHNLSLVYHRDGLLKLNLKPPLVLQEFVNHGGVIFKVYVVGDYVQCVKRKSLPDVPLEKLDSVEGSLSFSQVSNMMMQHATLENYESMHLEEAEMPPLSFVTDIARGLRRAMRLHLFNFDVIRDSKAGNHYFVIDINYFPGYEKMPSYETVLTDFFWRIVMAEDNAVGGGKKSMLVSSNHCDVSFLGGSNVREFTIEMSSNQSSISRRSVQHQQVLCDCNLPCILFTSRTERNSGRRFLRCPRNRTELDCSYFQWMHEPDQQVYEILCQLREQNEIIIKELKAISSQRKLWLKFFIGFVFVVGMCFLYK